MEVWQMIILGAAAFFGIRHFAFRYLMRSAKKRAFYKQYIEVLTLPEYKVKGNYEE
jgi:hypothetical protein